MLALQGEFAVCVDFVADLRMVLPFLCALLSATTSLSPSRTTPRPCDSVRRRRRRRRWTRMMRMMRRRWTPSSRALCLFSRAARAPSLASQFPPPLALAASRATHKICIAVDDSNRRGMNVAHNSRRTVQSRCSDSRTRVAACASRFQRSRARSRLPRIYVK